MSTTPRPWTSDLWGALASMLVALPSSIAFGVLVYTALGPQYAGAGALAGILGAAALGIVAPLVGRTAGLISAPCAPSAAVLSALVVGLTAGSLGVTLLPEEILPLIALTAVLAAVLQIAFGLLGGGRLIKYIPYPVVSGYLSGVGVIIALGQLPKLLGLGKGISLADGLSSPSLWQWEGLIVGVITMLFMFFGHKLTRRVPPSILGLGGGIMAYWGLSLVSPRLLTLIDNPLIIGPITTSGSVFDAAIGRMASLSDVGFLSVELIVFPAVTLAVLLSIDTLKTCVALDALTRTRHDSNRELIGQGCANLVSFAIGGMPGAGTMGPTLVNVTSGGRTPRAGIVEGSLVVVVFLLLTDAIAWVPIASLAGILLVIAWRMLDRRVFRLLRSPAGRVDAFVIGAVVLVSVSVDLIAASLVGVALAILLFLREQVRGTVIRRKMYLNQISSKTRRPEPAKEVLAKHGDLGVFCELQGNLFFGTTDQLRTQLGPDLASNLYVLFDMRRVDSIDYTAAHILEQMHSQLADRKGSLILSGMPSGFLDDRNFEVYLEELGVVRKGSGVRIFETMDGALEWMEDRILEAHGVLMPTDERPLEIGDFELFREFDEETIRHLRDVIETRSFKADETILAIGEMGNELFMVRRGSVRIMLPLEGGKKHHLSTIGRGDYFGEITFLDRGRRSAVVEAKEDVELYLLTRSKFDELSRRHPELGVRVFARLALEIGKRLRRVDAELAVLLDR